MKLSFTHSNCLNDFLRVTTVAVLVSSHPLGTIINSTQQLNQMAILNIVQAQPTPAPTPPDNGAPGGRNQGATHVSFKIFHQLFVQNF
jgi:hypothetical protein